MPFSVEMYSKNIACIRRFCDHVQLKVVQKLFGKFFRNSLISSTQVPFSVEMYSKNIACI